MKPAQILMVIMIVLGAVTGSTLATVAYLNRRQSRVINPNPLVLFKGGSGTPNSSFEKPITLQKKQNNSEFTQFRQRFLESVKRRDANFIRAISTPQTQWSRSGTIDIETYKIDDSQSNFWQAMEKAVGAGCTIERNANVAEKDADSDVWVCPDMALSPISNAAGQAQVGILGENVNVRSQPHTRSDIVVVLSKELVQFDTENFTNLPVRQQESINDIEGWTPVILNDGKRGWVQNRFVYYETRDYRVSFVRSRGQWRLRYFLRGGGN
ncbi:hypothetical protein MiSe_07430 [Microseira wollei NIES-4236]|uniref:SH3b domain-containing protein n=2 Tax=Microseira wollei TaxID=467598 RepID=A0AAV3X7D0_9CYAN|nr:hypothetical protein MiSe_07430 [Microseira wollei NIES-4236]